MRLSNVRLYPDTCALYGVADEDEGLIGVGLDDFEVPIPDDFQRRFNDWYNAVPKYGDSFDNLDAVHRLGRELAAELSLLIGQPVTYNE